MYPQSNMAAGNGTGNIFFLDMFFVGYPWLHQRVTVEFQVILHPTKKDITGTVASTSSIQQRDVAYKVVPPQVKRLLFFPLSIDMYKRIVKLKLLAPT